MKRIIKVFENIITKTNLNISSMLKYGSIASFTMLIIALFFGKSNLMLAFPIALTAVALSLENIHVKTFSKTLYLILFDCTLVILSYIATRNIYLGIFINFSVIFLISYFLTFNYNPKIYKPFLMLFIFTSFSHDNLYGLLNKLEATIIGVLLVIISTVLLNKNQKKKVFIDSLSQTLILFNKQFENLSNKKYDVSINEKISKEMRALAYSVYQSRFKKYLTSNKGRYQLELYLILEKFNISLDEFCLNKSINKDENNLITMPFNKTEEKFFIDLYTNTNTFTTSQNTSYNLKTLIKNLDNIIENNKKYSNVQNLLEFIEILNNLRNTLNGLNSLSDIEINKPYRNWMRSDLDTLKSITKRSTYKGSIRLNFALRLSFCLTITLFLGHIFSLYKVIWVTITIMSVMQIYYEDTINKSKERIIGNLIGIFSFAIIIFLIDSEVVAIITLVISLYLTYGFKEYYKLSTFTTLASISAASISTGFGRIALYRIGLVLLAVIIIFLANKFLFPSKIEDGIKILLSQILYFDEVFIEELCKYNKTPKKNIKSYNTAHSLLIILALTNEKLFLRNSSLKNKNINSIIRENNSMVVNLAYSKLIK